MQRDPDAVVFHLPHDSVGIPADLRGTLLLDDDALQRELSAMTDHHTVALFSCVDRPNAVIFPVSRLIVDPERFVDDAQEPMAQRGMGVIYTTCSTGQPLRHRPDTLERDTLLERFYHPHHASLTAAVHDAVSAHGYALILDCHSFPAAPRTHELHRADVRPDICLGTDTFHTPRWLTAAASDAFSAEGYVVTIDSPYAGTIVPLSHYRSDARVLSIMIEVNRGLYVNEDTREPLATFDAHRTAIRRVVGIITECTAHHFSEEHP
jgi:N-formylglutamate deformylase